jgi:predicted Fe-S protein YdhL (DUF1289 family)
MYDLNDVWNKPTPAPKSPCVSFCQISSQTGYCLGCYRSLREIRDWEISSDTEKEIILENVEKRKNALPTT